jgi:hypothetical protein
LAAIFVRDGLPSGFGEADDEAKALQGQLVQMSVIRTIQRSAPKRIHNNPFGFRSRRYFV